MVSHFDGSYNQTFRRTTYDSIEDQRARRMAREADEVLELRPPAVPTAEDEAEYIDWLQEDLKSDPWVTYRFRKYMAGPKRIPWKNMRELKRQYQYNFLVSWIAGAIISWPLATYIGRRYQRTNLGVPLVPMQWYKHDFINVSPGAFARRQFRLKGFGAAAVLGWCFAYYTTDRDGWRSDKHKTRPDLKPYPAMVKQDEDDITQETMQRALYKKAWKDDYKSSNWYRFLFPQSADFTVRKNPYREHAQTEIFNPKRPGYSTWTGTFQDHQN